MNKFIRHGDIRIVSIKEIPADAVKVETGKTFVVAEGETTGHKHLLTAQPLEVFKDAAGRFYFKVDSEAKISHEEHKTITIEPGIYEVGREREKDWFSLSVRRVVD